MSACCSWRRQKGVRVSFFAALSIASAAASAGVGTADFTLSAFYLPAGGFVDAHVSTTNICESMTGEYQVEVADGFFNLLVIIWPYCGEFPESFEEAFRLGPLASGEHTVRLFLCEYPAREATGWDLRDDGGFIDP